MNLKKPKIRIKLRLPVALSVIFLIIIILEVFTLFKTFYLDFRTAAQLPEIVVSEEYSINPVAYKTAQEWISVHESYSLPAYTLQGGGRGRENPFLEY